MRVRHLRSHVESEVFFIIVIDLVSNSNLHDSPFSLVSALQQYGIETRVQELLDVLDEHGSATGASLSERPLQVGRRLFQYKDLVLLLEVFDPLVCLLLWVDHQGPARGFGREDAVLDGDCVGRETLVVPLTDHHGVAHHFDDVEVIADRDLLRQAFLQPGHHHLFSVDTCEGAVVGDATAGDKDVAH